MLAEPVTTKKKDVDDIRRGKKSAYGMYGTVNHRGAHVPTQGYGLPRNIHRKFQEAIKSPLRIFNRLDKIIKKKSAV